MTERNSETEDTGNRTTIFQSPFPVPLNGKIGTWEFLIASKGIVTFLDTFGKMFIPVRSDMNGNISKLTNIYNMDINKNIYLDDMVLKDKYSSNGTATDALMWLVRGLHFVQRFFELFMEDFDNKTEELVPLITIAYSETLRPYHGWITQKLFKIIVRMCPCRTQLLQNLSCGNHICDKETEILRKMIAYTVRLKNNVTVVKEFYKDQNLETDIQV